MKVKVRPRRADIADTLPYPLNLGATVEYFAPSYWAKWDHQEPPADHPDHGDGMLEARRVYGEWFMRWATDQSLNWDEAKVRKVNSRPRW